MKIMERGLIRAELIQRQEEGCDIEEISTRIKAALDEDVGGAKLVTLYDELMELQIDESFSYVEPSTLGEMPSSHGGEHYCPGGSVRSAPAALPARQPLRTAMTAAAGLCR